MHEGMHCVENHVRENVGWILFKAHNISIFLEGVQ